MPGINPTPRLGQSSLYSHRVTGGNMGPDTMTHCAERRQALFAGQKGEPQMCSTLLFSNQRHQRFT